MLSNVHVCCFSALDDLPKKLHGSELHVLAALARAGKFSSFELSESPKLAAMVTALIKSEKVETKDLGYPWSGVELTNAGRAALEEAERG